METIKTKKTKSEQDAEAFNNRMCCQKCGGYMLQGKCLGSCHIFTGAGPAPAKELDTNGKLKPKGRGGKRPGAGRPYLETHQEADRKITKSITLSAATWEYLHDHSTDSLSKAIEALIQLRGTPNGTFIDGWTESRRSDYETEEKFNEHIKKAKAYIRRRDYEEATADDPRITE